jgi:SAM-dependent methyltransferase
MSKLLWNTYAQCYEAIAGLLPYQEMLDEVVAALEVRPGMRVLDAGCGIGVLAERLAKVCPDIEYLGVDLSSSMLARARKRQAWPTSFTFAEDNIDKVLADGAPKFDRIASVNVIWTLPDPRGTLGRMTMALRPGGRMVHTTPRLAFRAYVIVWRHLCGQKGWRRLRALLGLPVLLFAGLLNLALVIESMILARAPRAKQRWHKEGLFELARAAGAEPSPVRPCYAGQGLLLVAERPAAHAAGGNPLPGPGEHL